MACNMCKGRMDYMSENSDNVIAIEDNMLKVHIDTNNYSEESYVSEFKIIYCPFCGERLYI